MRTWKEKLRDVATIVLFVVLLVYSLWHMQQSEPRTNTPTTWTYMRTGAVDLRTYGVSLFDIYFYLHRKEVPVVQVSMEDAVATEIQGKLGEVIPVYETTLTEEERAILAQLVYAEANDQDMIGKQLVVDVVLNRCASMRYPNTVSEVIFQTGQFSTIADGAYARAASADLTDCQTAIEQELRSRIDYGILYFNYGPSCANGTNPWKHQDHWFAY